MVYTGISDPRAISQEGDIGMYANIQPYYRMPNWSPKCLSQISSCPGGEERNALQPCPLQLWTLSDPSASSVQQV